jgi:4a-hydroxytetrahydrobiopterin dehydratase
MVEIVMSIPNKPQELSARKCAVCESNIPKIAPEQAQTLLRALSGWQLVDDGGRIRKEWRMKDFKAGMALLNRVAELAEVEGHHPDLHLVNYRNVRIELRTHAISGLSDNDFIMAAKIDQLEV